MIPRLPALPLVDVFRPGRLLRRVRQGSLTAARQPDLAIIRQPDGTPVTLP
jgi:hypothetical protein